MLFAAGGGCDAAQVRLFAAGAGSLPLLWRLEKASGTKGPLGQRKPGSLILHRSPSLTLPGRKETLSGSRYCEIREADSECPFRQGQRVWLGRLTAPEDQGGGARGDVPKAWNTGGAAGVWVNGGAALPVRVVQQKAAGDDEEHWLLEAYHWTGGASGTTYTFVEDTGPEEQTAAAADGAAAEPESDDDAW